jgi:hypothetical protein
MRSRSHDERRRVESTFIFTIWHLVTDLFDCAILYMFYFPSCSLHTHKLSHIHTLSLSHTHIHTHIHNLNHSLYFILTHSLHTHTQSLSLFSFIHFLSLSLSFPLSRGSHISYSVEFTVARVIQSSQPINWLRNQAKEVIVVFEIKLFDFKA